MVTYSNDVFCLAWMSEGRAERGIRAVPAQRAAASGKTPMPTADGHIFYSWCIGVNSWSADSTADSSSIYRPAVLAWTANPKCHDITLHIFAAIGKLSQKGDGFLLETESLSTSCWMTHLQGSSFSPIFLEVPYKIIYPFLQSSKLFELVSENLAYNCSK